MQEDNVYDEAISELDKIASMHMDENLKNDVEAIIYDLQKLAAFDLDVVEHNITDFSDHGKVIAAYLNELERRVTILKRALSHFNKPQEALVRYNPSSNTFVSSYAFSPDLENTSEDQTDHLRDTLDALRSFAKDVQDIGRSLGHKVSLVRTEPAEPRRRPNLIQRALNRFRN